MPKIVRARYEKGVLKLLELVELEEGRMAQIVMRPSELITEKF